MDEIEKKWQHFKMDESIQGNYDKYELVKDIGFGNSGVAKLMRNKKTHELVAIKYIDRGQKIDKNVQREIINHRSLKHPNIVQFIEVMLTPTHLAIVMEYAAGGELFERISNAGHFSEDEQICHRDLKLENTLLDGSFSPRLKICDFGYSKSSLLHSEPTSTVGTPAYIAPEILHPTKEYDGKMADVWSCGVTLYVMLVGAYPFEDPNDTKNFKKTIGRILSVQYKIPENLDISLECRHLISRIFVANPSKRINIEDIKCDEWYQKRLPAESEDQADKSCNFEATTEPQSIDEIMKIIDGARIPLPDPNGLDDVCEDDDDAGSSGDYVCSNAYGL